MSEKKSARERESGRQFNLKLKDDDLGRFKAVALKYGLTVTSLFRMLVKRVFDNLNLRLRN